MKSARLLALSFALATALPPLGAHAASTNIAVAANFTEAAKEIAAAFKAKTGHEAVLSFGASGQFYTQIKESAPFQIFLSADEERPKKLADEGLAVADSRFTYVTSPVAGIPDFLAFNTKQPPFDNPKVRQAVALAISRSDIRDVAYLGTGELGLEEVPTGSVWYDAAGVFGAEQDIARAKQLLTEAGYPNGLSVEYLGLPQYPELLKTGQVVRDELKAIGIDMTIKPVDVSIWYDAYVAGNYQVTSAYQERTIDPDNFYSLVIKSGGPINTVQYSNPEVDALIDKAAASSDDAERKDIYRQIRTTVTADAPLVFVHYETLNYLMNKTVTGSGITPTLSLHMENVGFTQ